MKNVLFFLLAITLSSAFASNRILNTFFRVSIVDNGSTDTTIAISSPDTFQVFQRDDSDQGRIVISGTYSGTTPTKIQARALTRDGFDGATTSWTTITTSISGGTYSGAFNVRGGWYDLQVRAVTNHTVTGNTSVSKIGVGDIFIMAGQSNAANYGGTPRTPTDERVVKTDLTGTWAAGTDPQPSANNTNGSPWPAFGDALVALTNRPVAIFAVAQGGTSVNDWQSNDANYTDKLKVAIQSFPSQGFKAILWHQGESDAVATITQAAYATALRAIITNTRSDAGWTVPWGIAVTATYSEPDPLTSQSNVQAAQTEVAADSNNFVGANTDDLTSGTYRSDGTHMTNTGLSTHGGRWATKVATWMGL